MIGGRTPKGTSVTVLCEGLESLVRNFDVGVISGPNIKTEGYTEDHASSCPGEG